MVRAFSIPGGSCCAAAFQQQYGRGVEQGHQPQYDGIADAFSQGHLELSLEHLPGQTCPFLAPMLRSSLAGNTSPKPGVRANYARCGELLSSSGVDRQPIIQSDQTDRARESLRVP